MHSNGPPATEPTGITILLAGGSGFLGQALNDHFHRHQVLNLTRSPRPKTPTDVAWNPDGSVGDWADAVATADIIINLAGAGIADKRWTTSRKRLLRDSRIAATRSLVRAINTATPRDRLLISASGINVYDTHGSNPVTEATPPGDDFLARLCVDWEQEARRAASDRCRVAVIRSGMVLHPDGGALARMLPAFRLAAGASLGSGRQHMSWIHRDDWVALVAHIIGRHDESRNDVAVYNATAPTPVTNERFTRTLAGVLRRPAPFRAPAIALRVALGEMAEPLLLSGARVLPARAEGEGFRFDYPELEPALRNLLERP